MPTLFRSLSGRVPTYYTQKEVAEAKLGRKLSNKEFEEKYLVMPSNQSSVTNTGTSTFDPALCELMYVWFTAKGDRIIDPFAGGSVRGIVANYLGRHYVGVDVRQEQIDANFNNAQEVFADNPSDIPTWFCADSRNITDIASGFYDFLLTCPPYGDLEVYSDNPADISNMCAEDFDAAYDEIMQKTASMVRDNRFAAVVVGNYRDKNGFMRDLNGLTIRAMEKAGMRFYNDIVYVQTAGSLPIRCGAAFKKTRKVGKMHQNVLIFCKGDPAKAAERLGDVQIPDIEEYFDNPLEESLDLP